MKIYNYHPITKEYLSESTADESPLEPGVFVIPAYATALVPPVTGQNQVAVFEGNEWITKPDFRGQKYYRKSDLTEIIISEIGNIPSDLISEIPVKPSEYHKWNGNEYIFSEVYTNLFMDSFLSSTIFILSFAYLLRILSNIPEYLAKY